MIFPLTLKLLNIPTLVILGWLFVVTVPAVVAEPALVAYVALATTPVTFAPTKFDKPIPLPVNTPVFAVMFTAVMFPFTANIVIVPTLVILGCDDVVNTPVNKLAEIVLLLVIFPLTLKLLNIPTLVILGWLLFVTVPAFMVDPLVSAYVALATVPITFAAASWLKPLPLPVNTPVFAVTFTAVMFPFTASAVIVPTLVIFGWAETVTLPA